MVIQYPNMKNPAAINVSSENKNDALYHNSKAIKMITTDLAIDKIEAKGLEDNDVKFSNVRAATRDKRSESRNQMIFKLKCKTYNTESDTFEISDAIAHNYSTNGLYLETNNPFQPDDPVCLSLRDQITGKYDSEFAIGVHAQIVWCKPLNTNFDPMYGVGVKFFEPVESHLGVFKGRA